MSVWQSSVTRLATAKDIYESSTTLFEVTYGSKIYPHIKPDYEATGWDRDTTWVDVATDLNWEAPGEKDGTKLLENLENVEKVYIGLSAYFQVVKAVMRGEIVVPEALNHTRLEDLVDQCLHFVGPSTQVAVSAFVDKCTQRDMPTLAKGRKYYDVADKFKALKRANNWEDQDEEYVNYFADLLAQKSLYVYRKVGRVHMLLGIGPYASRAIVLSGKGMDMVIGSLERIAALHEFLGRSWAGSPTKIHCALALLEAQVLRASSVSQTLADKVPKAWHEVRTYAQYLTLNSIMADAVVAIEVEYVTDGFADVIPLADALGLVTGPDDATTMELVHIYKWMPPPEYDMTTCLPLIRDLHRTPRISGANDMATDKQRESYAKIKAERNMNLLAAIYRMKGKYPDNLIRASDHPTIAEAAAWDHRAVLRYEHMGRHISSQVKDKTTVKASIEDEVKSNGGEMDQNYLSWYLTNWEDVDTKRWLTEFANGTLPEDRYSRVAYKGESQKENSRPFYMAPPISRTLLAEHEGNLSKVAKFYPAALIGKSEAATGAMMDEAMDPYAFNKTTNPETLTTTYIVMFDVSKWSPKSDGKQVKEYHKFWSEVYGEDKLASLSKIGCEDEILSTTDGVTIRYKNHGADLEGYRGRMGTMYHADMLGAVCREAVRKKCISGKSNLVVFIDDGAVKIEAIGIGEVAKANALKFLGILKEIYAGGGQEVHDRKVVISERGGEILANFYLDGVKVPQGIKAAMKITSDYTNPVASLVDANDSIFASCQGALKGGADVFTTYTSYLVNVGRNYCRFNRNALQKINHTTWAIMNYMPKSFGGFGTQSLQGLVTTCVTNLTAEGLSILNRAARAYPKLRHTIRTIITSPVIKRDPLSILRDPTRVALAGPSLIESRLTRYVVSTLITKEPTLARFVQGATADDLKRHATEIAERLLSSSSISVPLLIRAWSATPLAQIETIIGKFERSDTIIRLIGYQMVGKLRRANQNDVVNITDFCLQLTGNV